MLLCYWSPVVWPGCDWLRGSGAGLGPCLLSRQSGPRDVNAVMVRSLVPGVTECVSSLPGKLASGLGHGGPGDSDEGIHHPDPGDNSLQETPSSLSTFSRLVSSASRDRTFLQVVPDFAALCSFASSLYFLCPTSRLHTFCR